VRFTSCVLLHVCYFIDTILHIGIPYPCSVVTSTLTSVQVSLISRQPLKEKPNVKL